MSINSARHNCRELYKTARISPSVVVEDSVAPGYAISDYSLHANCEASVAFDALWWQDRLACQQVMSVLSHEINNSLAPIRSISLSLGRMVSDTALDVSLAEPLSHGLELIHERADWLSRFLQSYTRVAAIPAPVRRDVALNDLLAHVAALETRLAVKVVPGCKVDIYVDPDQLKQALINLVKNAVDAVLIAPADDLGPEAVTLACKIDSQDIEILVQDEGTGLSETENLVVPFCTTKKAGSGIGLLLARQILKGHQGTLVLRNRCDRSGCRAEVKLPRCVVGASEASTHNPNFEV
jgi:two-component system, NtrC family, nitrogen regulation sensor histidine kinase NtrY